MPSQQQVSALRASSLTDNLHSFFQLLETVAGDPSCRLLQEVVAENETLHNRVAALVHTKEEHEISIAALRLKLTEERSRGSKQDEDIKELKKQSFELEQKLAVCEAQFRSKLQEAVTLGKSLEECKKRLQWVENALEGEERKVARSDELKDQILQALKRSTDAQESLKLQLDQKTATLTSLTRLMAPTLNIPKERVVTALEELFSAAHQLATTFFTTTLPPMRLVDTKAWAPLRSYQLNKEMALRLAIPLPQTNTAAARYMRAAACLAVIGSTLVHLVFRPTYFPASSLSSTTNDIGIIMVQLAESDPEKETHLRAVLRGLMSEEEVAAEADRRAKMAAEEVLHCVQKLVVDTETELRLGREIENVCRMAANVAVMLQSLEAFVHPSVEYTFESESKEWKALLIEVPEQNVEPLSSTSRSDKEAIGNKRKDHESKRDKKRRTGNASSMPVSPITTSITSGGGSTIPSQLSPMIASPLLDSSDFDSRVVWPSFSILRDGEPELLYPGFVIGGGHFQDAKRELNSMGQHRAARLAERKSRAMSLPVVAVNGAETESKSGPLDGTEVSGIA